MAESTHIRVKEDTVDRLYSLKSRKESYDDVIRKLLETTDAPLDEQEHEETEA